MPHVAARTASRDRDTGRYQSHRPEQTLLYQIVDEYYPAFAALMAEQGKELPGYVQRKRLVRTVLIFTESSDQLSRATDRVPGLPASPGYVQ